MGSERRFQIRLSEYNEARFLSASGRAGWSVTSLVNRILGAFSPEEICEIIGTRRMERRPRRPRVVMKIDPLD